MLPRYGNLFVNKVTIIIDRTRYRVELSSRFHLHYVIVVLTADGNGDKLEHNTLHLL